jgi:predicted N-acetyltransferase YhbS
LIEATNKAASAAGVKLVLLVGDEPYYSTFGFKRVPRGRVTLPGPVDSSRILVAELVPGAFEGVEGPTRPDYRAAPTA